MGRKGGKEGTMLDGSCVLVTGHLRSAATGFSAVGKASAMVGEVIQKSSFAARKKQWSSLMDVPSNKNKSKKFMKRLVMRWKELFSATPGQNMWSSSSYLFDWKKLCCGVSLGSCILAKLCLGFLQRWPIVRVEGFDSRQSPLSRQNTPGRYLRK